jgi:DNA polymerase-3 subunit delta
METAAFVTEVARGTVPVVLLHGSEPRLLDEIVAGITRALVPDPSLLALSREVFDAAETSSEIIVRSALTLPSLTPARLVVVRQAQALSEKDAKALADYLRSPNPSTRLLFVAGAPLPATHWLVRALPRSAVVEIPALTGRALVSWLRARAQAEGYELTDGGAELLFRWAGADLTTLTSELLKACAFAGPETRRVTEEEVRQVLGEHRVTKTFELADAVSRRQIGQALPLLDALLAAGEEPLYLLGALTREVRTIWQIKAWLQEGKSADEIGRLLRRPAFAVSSLAAAATSLSTGVLRQGLRRCWETERRLKSGDRPGPELTALVAELCGAG